MGRPSLGYSHHVRWLGRAVGLAGVSGAPLSRSCGARNAGIPTSSGVNCSRRTLGPSIGKAFGLKIVTGAQLGRPVYETVIPVGCHRPAMQNTSYGES